MAASGTLKSVILSSASLLFRFLAWEEPLDVDVLDTMKGGLE